MDLNTILITVMGVITGASLILKAIAPLTKTKKDDKVLKFLLKVLEVLSLHVKEKEKKLDISINKK